MNKLEIYKNLLVGLDKLLIEVLFEVEFPEMTEDDKNGLEIVIHHAIGTNTFDVDGDFYESKEDYIRSKAALQMLKLTKEYFDSLENE